ncbi:MAG: GGDEF domain-containing protein [Siculibacillus sp.]|nr:GGDEF domain-containing protein [Siculibacillus sp.]
MSRTSHAEMTDPDPDPDRDRPFRAAVIAGDQIVNLAKLVVEHALQPIVEVETGRVHGHEALMRGVERLGLRSPTELLDLAAESGRISALERMLQSRAMARFTLVETQGEKLFLNLDGRAIDPRLEVADHLIEALRRSGLAPSAVVVELSERHDHLSNPTFPEFLRRLKHHGIRVAIDDFGIGVSELRLLCDHGLDYLKIDKTFIRGMAENPRKRLIVAKMTDLAHVLGVRVVAEGVETASDYHAVREAGCDLLQGWFIAAPTTEVETLARSYGGIVGARASRRRDLRNDGLLVRAELKHLPTIAETCTLEEVFDLFRRHPQESFFPVVDAAGCPRGIVHERDLKQYIYNPYGRDLLRNKIYGRGFASFVTSCPMADVDTDIERLLETFAHSRGSDGVIVTESLRYLGVLTTGALLEITNAKLIQKAQDQNPLTELPGNLSIADFVSNAALDGARMRTFCYFDFDGFKPFNDRYGFRRGDEAIMLFAQLLRRRFGAGDAFVGHIGGDDFFAGLVGKSIAEVSGEVTLLLDEFRREVAELYAPADRVRGGLEGIDRDGNARFYRLMRCSASILQIPVGTVTAELDHIAGDIAELKSAAKKSSSGLAVRSFVGCEPQF